MGRGRAAGYDEQRETILARAAELFAQRGYSATTMNQVAEACGLSKPALYHYYKDKYALLVSIADTHVSRLEALVGGVLARKAAPRAQMRALVTGLVGEYAFAQHAHRVLTEEVKFLEPDDQRRILEKERAIVSGFAKVVTAIRPDLAGTPMGKPLTMLLFGMINWMFTWMRPDGELGYDEMGPMVADLFLNGLSRVAAPGEKKKLPD